MFHNNEELDKEPKRINDLIGVEYKYIIDLFNNKFKNNAGLGIGNKDFTLFSKIKVVSSIPTKVIFGLLADWNAAVSYTVP